MQNYTGIPASSLPDTKAPDFTPRLKNMLSTIDFFLRDASAGFGRIENGQAPSGSGAPISVTSHHALSDLTTFDDHSQYLYLAGRTGGQTVFAASAGDCPLEVNVGSSPTTDGFRVVTATGNRLVIDKDGITTLTSSTTNDVLALPYSAGGRVLRCGGGVGSAIYGITPGNTTLASDSSHQHTWTNKGLIFRCSDAATTALVVNYSVGSVSTDLQTWAQNGSVLSRIKSNGAFSGPGAAGGTGTGVVVGSGTSSAGVLGASDLTAQTGSIGAVTLLTGGASTAGMYRVSVYMVTTTAGTALDVVKATVAWNDGAAQTLDVPLLTTAGAATNLDLATLNAKAQGSVVVYAAASQNITYTTTVTKTGTPQYAIHVRIEALG